MRLHHRFAKAFITAAVCAIFMSGEILFADTETASTPIPSSDAAVPPGTASFTLPQFNPALGTLTGIALDFTLNYQGEVEIINVSGSAQTFTASSSVPIAMETPSTSGLVLVAATYSLSSAVPATPGVYPFPGPVSNGTFPFNPAPAVFPDYEGVGSSNYTLSYQAGTYTGTDNTGDPGVFFGGDANSSGSASVTYTYSPVPEPSSLALLVMGVFALAFVARSRFRKMEIAA